MALKSCVKCGRRRSEKYMQQAEFVDPHDYSLNEPVDVWKCASNESCKKARKERRPPPKKHDGYCELPAGFPDARCTCEPK